MTNRSTSWIGSTAKLTCPKCRIGRLFPTATFSFSEPFEMPKHCSVCDQNYFPEPGFYYGAMFASYIVFSFPCLGFVFLLHWVFGMSLSASMFWLILIGGIGFIYVFRFSRSLWIHMNISYDEELSDRLLREKQKA